MSKPSDVTVTIKDGLRYIEPYEFVFETHAKGRWMGRSVMEVFLKEFKMYSQEYYIKAFEDGRITINDEKSTGDYILGNNDRIRHTTTYVENPVLADPVKVLHDADDIIVVSKPSSIPIHPCGAYRHNSLIFMVERMLEMGHAPLPTHRIDRLTSGLVLLARDRNAACKITKLFEENKVHKSYLARVRGDASKLFAEGAELKAGVTKTDDRIHVVGYVRCECHKDGKYQFSADQSVDSKISDTNFEFVSYNEKADESIVHCYPGTGRTHQIRLHLQYLGVPITNDRCYGGELMHTEHSPLLPHMADGVDVKHPSGIYLHAYTYAADGVWNFQSPRPSWAQFDE